MEKQEEAPAKVEAPKTAPKSAVELAKSVPVKGISFNELAKSYGKVADTGDVEAVKTFIRRIADISNEGNLSGFAPHYTKFVEGVSNPEPGKHYGAFTRPLSDLLGELDNFSWAKVHKDPPRSEVRTDRYLDEYRVLGQTFDVRVLPKGSAENLNWFPENIEPGDIRSYLSRRTYVELGRSEIRTSRREFLKGTVAATLGAVLAPTVPTQLQAQQARAMSMADQAKATVLGMFSLVEEKTGLVVDKARIDARGNVLQMRNQVDFMKTSPTNIGLGIVSVIMARDQGWISQEEASAKLTKMVSTLEKMERHRGFWYNWYNLASLDAQGAPRVTLNQFISSVDIANLAAGLMVLREAVDGTPLAGRVQKLLDDQDWNFFYNKEVGLMSHGYDAAKRSYSEYDYGTFNTEARLLSFISVLQGVDQKAWDNMSREVLADKTGKILVVASWGGVFI